MLVRLENHGALAHNFGCGTPYRLGVEEELFLVDPAAPETIVPTDTVVGGDDLGILGEMCDGVIEFATPVCANAGQARDALRALRAKVCADGVSLIGAGIHPTAPFGEVRYRETPHYLAVAADVRGLMGRAAYCGTHVHVGMPDAETAVTAFNGMRRWVPLLQALAANSPFWHGIDSGMASARTVVCHSLPRTGVPRPFADWADCEATMRELVRVGQLDGLGSIWWDLRPHPTLGTLEFRGLDAQSRLEDLAGLAALVHCLVQHEALTARGDHPAPEILQEASFRAVRDGLDATFSLGGPIRHVADHAREALDLASGYSLALGCASELRHVERMLAEGNGATRQRRAFERGGMTAVLEHLAAETRGAEPAPAAQAA